MSDEIRYDRFGSEGLDGIIIGDSICYKCKHVHHPKRLTCDAFPEGIPGEIIGGDVKHKEPYPGDNDIQYELNPLAI